MKKCPDGGCPRGEPRKLMLESGRVLGIIFCHLVKDMSWHPVSKGRDCPLSDEKTVVCQDCGGEFWYTQDGKTGEIGWFCNTCGKKPKS